MSSYNRSSSKKYLQLRSVTSKHAPEIVYLLPDKFSIFSSSSILQNDNDREFANNRGALFNVRRFKNSSWETKT